MVNNNPLPFETGRGLSISYLGKNLYSKYNPLKNAFQIAKNQILDEETLYIIPSPLLLYGVEVLLKKLPESSYLLGIEIDQQLMKMTLDSNHSFEDGFKTVRLESKEQLKIVIEDLGTWRFRRCEMIPLNYG
ncbi:MAG: hypothetical protein GY756_03510, partial [bacterium]|nr:hypothetical protein [bacterium]